MNTNEREIKRLQKTVDVINGYEKDIKKLSDEDLKNETEKFKERLNKGETLDDMLPRAFAVAREASFRVTGMRPFDVQVIGGIVLHEGKIAEMKTGEGKTLAAVLPAYLNGLTGQGVHIVTVNDYLAKRDREWMGPIYEFLGLSAGVIIHDMSYEEKKNAYGADITYGTNNEFGFDYLRDNMTVRAEEMVQGDLSFAIIDEVDSILIDEARTPLIISGAVEQDVGLYYKFAKITPRLKKEEHYTVDEKASNVILTEEGIKAAESMLDVGNLFDSENMEISHYLNQALRAHTLMKKDRDYVVKDGEVVIVDEFTGRLMFGRRYSAGLHQAIEAKEGVDIRQESQTLASISFQNYFRMYEKLSGMTGTAETEQAEFKKIYELEVIVIPTNEPMIRKDNSDLIYKSEKAKFDAIINEIKDLYNRKQPVLVGTVSIERSEMISQRLQKENIPHEVLNAKYHEKEAEIISNAGQMGTVTIATNMAGRGADIVLGEGVRELGGLHIIGTERHESRRIDNQLRGRAGRQGDRGSSRFYVSLEDDLMRLFGSDRIGTIMSKLGWQEDQPIEHSQISRAIENAQRKVEERNFDIRKQILKYDDVMNEQRKVIYEQRKKVLTSDNLRDNMIDMLEKVVGNTVDAFATDKAYSDDWDLEGLIKSISDVSSGMVNMSQEELSDLKRDDAVKIVLDRVIEAYNEREQEVGSQLMRQLERGITLRMVDNNWMDHLYAMDELRRGIGLRAFGQRDPLIEYKYEAYDMFKSMVDSIREDTVKYLFRIQVSSEDPTIRQRRIVGRTNTNQIGINAGVDNSQRRNEPQQSKEKVVQRKVEKIGRNEPCPCGSGKKYKKCCGKK